MKHPGWLNYLTRHNICLDVEIPPTDAALDDYQELPDICKVQGHEWECMGGRGCPKMGKDEDSAICSQAVFQCRRCGLMDHGEPGGPAAAECGDCDGGPNRGMS